MIQYVITRILQFSYFRFTFHDLRSLQSLSIVSNDPTNSVKIEDGVFDDIPQVNKIQLVSLGVRSFPSNLFCGLDQLIYLNLRSNNLTNMRDLGINFTEDPSSMETIGNATLPKRPCLRNLHVLDLTYNKLSTVKFTLKYTFPKLAGLLLNKNNIHVIYENAFTGMNLRDLGISYNLLKSVPRTMFYKCRNVVRLDMRNNSLSYIHNDVFQYLHGLLMLNLNNNSLTSATLSNGLFDHTTKLMHLDIGNNQLETLDYSMFKGLFGLQFLKLSVNRIFKIMPYTFKSQQSLFHLDLSYNLLTALNDNILQGLGNLTELSFAGNRLVSIEYATLSVVPRLLYLNLTDNRFQSVPSGLGGLNKLSHLDLSNNHITNISVESFRNLTDLASLLLNDNQIVSLSAHLFKYCNRLLYLELSNNNISNLDRKTFEDLFLLMILSLDNNKINDLSNFLIRLANLQRLYVSKNRIVSIVASNFPRNIEVINLQMNRLYRIGKHTFKYLTYLKEVDLSYNNLGPEISPEDISITHSHLKKTTLYLRGNPLRCHCHMLWLKHINAFYNPTVMFIADLHHLLCFTVINNEIRQLISVDDKDFVCLFEYLCNEKYCGCCAKYADLTKCNCTAVCPRQCICYWNDIGRMIVNCSNQHLNEFPENIPEQTTELIFRNNSLSTIYLEDLRKLTLLEIIDFSFNHIDFIRETFPFILKLHTISLSHNYITRVTKDTFSRLRSLQILYIDHNCLNGTMDLRVFEKNTFLNIIRLDENKLSHIIFGNFEEYLFWAKLYLSSNPWDCRCASGPSLQHSVTRNVEAIPDAVNMTCDRDTMYTNAAANFEWKYTNSTPHVSGNITQSSHDLQNDLHLLRIDFTFCFDNTSNITIERTKIERVNSALATHLSIIVISVISVAFIATMLCLRYRENIKVYIFTNYGIRFGAVERDISKFYDAFVSYCSEDDSDIFIEIVEKLEKQRPNYRLCIHSRDFLGGASIGEAIVEAVQLSRRTIILLSNAFLKSEWCNYEFQIAHHNLLMDKTIRVIVILLEEVERAGMSRELKMYMKTNTYMVWGEPNFWDKLRYAMPDVNEERGDVYDLNLLPPGNRPTNLLLPMNDEEEMEF